MNDPKCPECGRNMIVPVYHDHTNKTWIACCRCNECEARWRTRHFIEKTKEEAENKARFAALLRPVIKPLTFDECMVYGDTEQQIDMIPDPVWLEYRDPDGWTGWICLQDHVYHPPEDPRGRGLYIMHPGCDVEGKSEYEADYGKTWRCWSRRPTDQEKAEAEWNG